MSGPFTSPVAQSVPFEPNRNGSDIEAINVQDAIEEAKQDAINNDRFLVLASYGGGNANIGRYLEFFPSLDSSVAPIFLAAAASCLSLVVSSASNSNGTLGIFDLNISSSVPLFTANYNGTSRVVFLGSPAVPLFNFSTSAQIAIRVTQGSVSKPYLQLSLSANT